MLKGFNCNERPDYPRPPAPPSPPPTPGVYSSPSTVAPTTRHQVTIVGYNHEKQNRLAYHLWQAAIDTDWHLDKVVTISREDLPESPPVTNRDAHFRFLLYCAPNVDHTIIINLFDRRPGYEWVQASVFDTIWSLYKKCANVQVVVIGSLAHHFPGLAGVSERYIQAKQHLAQLMNKTYVDALNSKARLLYIELGVLESMLEQSPPWPARYFTNKEAARAIIDLARANKKIMFTGLTGPNVWTPPSPPQDTSCTTNS